MGGKPANCVNEFSGFPLEYGQNKRLVLPMPILYKR